MSNISYFIEEGLKKIQDELYKKTKKMTPESKRGFYKKRLALNLTQDFENASNRRLQKK